MYNSIDFYGKKCYIKSIMKIKKWEKPKLIVLERGRPEEAVLGTCKSNPGGNGPGGGNCQWTAGPACDAQSGS
jgi:hypothetical protein